MTSVARALRHLGEDCLVTDDPETLSQASRIIFPGVGAAGDAMANLRERRLDVWIRDWLKTGRPLLGICLGTQVIFEHSSENETTCLSLVSGMVKRFPENLVQEGRPLKIPHMGWNQVRFTRCHPVFQDLPEAAEFYFVHSYYPAPEEKRLILGTTEYGIEFCSVVARDNLVAVQFHPEKSGKPGLQILRNFCRWGGVDAQ